jgi:hypothetical protein
MDDVTVHDNFSKPAQLQELACMQGVDIHVSTGQEKNLLETWHVVPRKWGRCRPREMANNDHKPWSTEQL